MLLLAIDTSGKNGSLALVRFSDAQKTGAPFKPSSGLSGVVPENLNENEGAPLKPSFGLSGVVHENLNENEGAPLKPSFGLSGVVHENLNEKEGAPFKPSFGLSGVVHENLNEKEGAPLKPSFGLSGVVPENLNENEGAPLKPSFGLSGVVHETLELVPLAGRMYSAQVIPSLHDALARQNLKKTDLDAFIIASGPGSFTGLRVGLSTVKALSEVLHKPIVAVSVLEAAARVTNVDSHVIVALDAGRKQVFLGDYKFSTGEHTEALVAWEEFFNADRNTTATIFSPDATVREAAVAHAIKIQPMESPQADVFARLGYEKLLAGDTTPADTLEANYIRASDAELFSLPKLLS